jgi:hypothetical protein
MAGRDNQKQPVEVSREELYRQVWATPMSRLAAQYGISGNGLAKICDRLKVPYPPRGYWSKLAAGMKVVKYRLLSPAADAPDNVTITPTPPPPPPPDLTPEIKTKVEAAREDTESVPVPERLSRPHPVIAKWLADHDRRKREARAEPDPTRRSLHAPGKLSQSDKRQYRILDALFKALERHGGKASEHERWRLNVEMQGEKVELQLRERQKHGRRPLAEWEKKSAAKDDKGWRFALESTGRLVFTIKTRLPGGLRTEWKESDRNSMESMLPDIVATFVAAGPLLVEQRIGQTKLEHERHVAEMKRYEEEQRRKLNENRLRRFMEIAQRHHQLEIAASFLAALKVSSGVDVRWAGNGVDDWIAWMEERIAEASSLNIGKIFGAVAEVTTWSYRD